MSESKEVAAPKKTIESWLTGEEFKRQIALALPKHITADRFLRVSLTALTKTPKLKECDPHSFFSQMLTLSQLGLEPDGRLAHLIPFRNAKRNVTECQLIVDYKGLADLAMRSGIIANIHADKVCKQDRFRYNIGVVEKHEIDFDNPRGKPYAYYAQVIFKDGTKKADCMTLEEVQAIRKRSRAANDGPWVTDFDEMGKKTVFRRLSKWLPLSPEYRDALEADADSLEEKRFAAALPATASSLPNFELPAHPPSPAAAESAIADAAAQEVVDQEKKVRELSAEQMSGESVTVDPGAGDESAIPTAQDEVSIALAEIDFSEERFVEGLRLLGLPVARSAKTVQDLSDAACQQAYQEGFDGIIQAIEVSLEKSTEKKVKK